MELSIGSTAARFAAEFMPPNHTEVNPAASIWGPYFSGSIPDLAGGDIQIPIGPSTRRSSSAVMAPLYPARLSPGARGLVR